MPHLVILSTARARLGPDLAARPVDLTLHVGEGQEAFDGKFGNLHALFARP